MKTAPLLFVGAVIACTGLGAANALAGDIWSTAPLMPTIQPYAAATAYNGTIYVIGGQNGGPLSTVQTYSPASGWGTAASLPKALTSGDGAAVIGSKIYAPGGWPGSVPGNDLSIFDPNSSNWTSGTSMPATSGDGLCGAIGGNLYTTSPKDGGDYSAYFYEYSPGSTSWTTLSSSPVAHGYAAGGVINGKLYVAGGVTPGAVTDELDVFDPSGGWSTLAPMPTAVYGSESGIIDGRLYVVGGLIDGDTLTTAVQVYDPSTNSWSADTAIPISDAHGSAAVLGESMYVFGTDGHVQVLTVPEPGTLSLLSLILGGLAMVRKRG